MIVDCVLARQVGHVGSEIERLRDWTKISQSLNL
jgi:hypothetical protein